MQRIANRLLLARLAAAPMALAAFTAPLAPARADTPLYVVLSFGEPGDTDPLARDATTNLTVNLSDRRIRSAVATADRYDRGGRFGGKIVLAILGRRYSRRPTEIRAE